MFEAIDELVRGIKEELGDYDVLKVDDLSLRNDLCAMRENKDFIYFRLLALLQDSGGAGDLKGITFAGKLSTQRWDEILYNEILPQVDPYDIISRRMLIGALLVGKVMPEHLKNHLAQIKECYTWGFTSAAAIYCRTILEEGFRETLKSRPEFRTPEQRRQLEGWSLDWLLNHSRKNKYFYREVIEKAYKIKENVNHIVHPTSAKKPELQIQDLDIIKDTFYILEMLFR